MPSARRPGKKTLYVELPEDLHEEFERFCEARGEDRTQHVAWALRRHMEFPPPPPVVHPLPPVPAVVIESPPVPPVPKKRGRPRKKE